MTVIANSSSDGGITLFGSPSESLRSISMVRFCESRRLQNVSPRIEKLVLETRRCSCPSVFVKRQTLAPCMLHALRQTAAENCHHSSSSPYEKVPLAAPAQKSPAHPEMIAQFSVLCEVGIRESRGASPADMKDERAVLKVPCQFSQRNRTAAAS